MWLNSSVKAFVPPRSPFGLIQEDLVPREWLILVACMMLNCTSRKQVEKVLPTFIERWPSPSDFLDHASRDEVEELLRPLGFAIRRTRNIFRMTERYLTGPWVHAKELPGIGEYAARAWEIFCRGVLGTEAPKDHALTQYYAWAKERRSE